MTLKFVPPKLVARYALFVDHGNESGSFKVYHDLGHAKNAWHHNGRYYNAKILEYVDGEWYVLFDVPKGVENPPWYKEVTRGWRYDWSTYKTARPMTREEYAEWRLAVERERMSKELGVSFS
jgi:hypothetical protein